MKTFPAILVLCTLLLVACDKGDPRCTKVADTVGMIGLSTAAEQLGEASEQMDTIKKQLEKQKPKVIKQCNDRLANDKSGAASQWVDCMAAATTVPDAMKCGEQ